MSDAGIPEGAMREMLKRAGIDPETSVISRRRWPRYETTGDVAFHRHREKEMHRGFLVDISEGGLAFFTKISVAVGETLLLTYREEGEGKSAEATVETVHSHPRGDEFLVGVRFVI